MEPKNQTVKLQLDNIIDILVHSVFSRLHIVSTHCKRILH